MRRTSLFSVLAAAVLVSGCAGGGGPSSLRPLPPLASQEYRLGTGDKIRLNVYGLDAMNAEYTVGDSGFLSLPMIQGVTVAGMTLRDVEQAIANKLREQQILRDPVVNVQYVTLRPFYIMGEVRNPGEYAFRPGTTVQSAVALAGGFTYRATTGAVAITRVVNGREVTGSARQDTPIIPGDRIRVFEKWF